MTAICLWDADLTTNAGHVTTIRRRDTAAYHNQGSRTGVNFFTACWRRVSRVANFLIMILWIFLASSFKMHLNCHHRYSKLFHSLSFNVMYYFILCLVVMAASFFNFFFFQIFLQNIFFLNLLITYFYTE